MHYAKWKEIDSKKLNAYISYEQQSIYLMHIGSDSIYLELY